MTSKSSWPEIYTGPWIVTGNVAKVKVIHALYDLISQGLTPTILDIGCVGLRPLEFWEPLLVSNASLFHLTGVDIQGIEKARTVISERRWEDRVTLLQGTGYDLDKLFAPHSFHVVTATQVLEHVPQLLVFMQQVATVLRPGGQGFFTVDSAHWQSRFDIRDLGRLLKNIAKKGLSLVSNHTHYDLPWFDHEVITACQKAGLETVDIRYYNLAPLKFLHNHVLLSHRKNAFVRLWFELEEFLNEEETVRKKTKHLFLGFYLHVRKPCAA